jgi:hypothetical protein
MHSPHFCTITSRRHWLRLGSSAILATLAGKVAAAESTSKWTEQSIAKYTGMLMDWLKADFAQRASTLASATAAEFQLAYDYLAPSQDKSRQRTFEKFAEGRLANRATEEHVTRCLTEFESVRQRLAAAEAKAALVWQAPTTAAEVREGKIYDSTVKSGRLTVVLDNSRSMAPFLEAVRAEISRDFAAAYFVEVNGCEMSRKTNCQWFFAGLTPTSNPFSPQRHIPKVPQFEDRPHATFIGWTRNAPSALEGMIDLMKADAIYWFCDFDDPTDDAVIRDFGRKLTDHKVKLYIHTLGKRPPQALAELAEASGGRVVRKRI